VPFDTILPNIFVAIFYQKCNISRWVASSIQYKSTLTSCMFQLSWLAHKTNSTWSNSSTHHFTEIRIPGLKITWKIP